MPSNRSAYRMAAKGSALLIPILSCWTAPTCCYWAIGQPGMEVAALGYGRVSTATVGLFAFCSIAVSLHSLSILRDEIPSTAANSLRLDRPVFLSFGNLMADFDGGRGARWPPRPPLVLAACRHVPLFGPPLWWRGVPITMLSKLPAVALGRTDFLSAILPAQIGGRQLLADRRRIPCSTPWSSFPARLGAHRRLVLLLRQANPTLAVAAGLVLSIPFNLFFTLFSVSVLTSLYGFFVEKRDF